MYWQENLSDILKDTIYEENIDTVMHIILQLDSDIIEGDILNEAFETLSKLGEETINAKWIIPAMQENN